MDLSKLNEADQKFVKSHIESLCRYILKRRGMFSSYLDECDGDPTLAEVAKASIYWSITDIAKDLSDLGFTSDALNLIRVRADVDIPGMLFILDKSLKRLIKDYPQKWTAVDVEELEKFEWKSLKDQRVWIIIKCVHNEDGNHMFEEKDSEKIKKLSPNLLARIFATSMKLSNFPWIKQQKDFSKQADLKSDKAIGNANLGKPLEIPLQGKFAFSQDDIQAFFDQKDIDIPSGPSIKILRLLVNSMPNIVQNQDLNEASDEGSSGEAQDQLRSRISIINTKLRIFGAPCHIENKRGSGYVMKEKKQCNRKTSSKRK